MHVVKASELNLRSSPKVVSTNRVGLLPRGHAVERIDVAGHPWWKVRTTLSGTLVEGYVSSVYLVPAQDLPALPMARGVVEVHLETTAPVTRARDGGRAFALNEAGAPRRDAASAEERVRQLQAIVRWLQVETSARYLPRNSTTYCNIYSYDYCWLAGAYLPRVWWNSSAVGRLEAGEPVAAVLRSTVNELNANSLHLWLQEYGPRFGWRREFGLDALQQAANEGSVCILSAQHVDPNQSGHVCPVVPESATHRADRRADGSVRSPLQTNAGRSNFQSGTPLWWTAAKFRSSSFWIHD